MKKRNPKDQVPGSAVTVRSLSIETFFLLFFGISLLGVIFLQSEHFRWLRGPIVLPAVHLSLMLALSFVLIAAGYHQISAFDPRIDLPEKVAHPILAVIFFVAAYLMFHRIDQPVSCYWDDPAVCIIDPRKIVDFHDFH